MVFGKIVIAPKAGAKAVLEGAVKLSPDEDFGAGECPWRHQLKPGITPKVKSLRISTAHFWNPLVSEVPNLQKP